MDVVENIGNNISNKVKELDQQFDIKYQEVCELNQDRTEKEYTLKERLIDMSDILEQKYILLIQDPKELEEKLKMYVRRYATMGALHSMKTFVHMFVDA